MGDGRTYEYVIALRAVETKDFMTAGWYPLPYADMAHISGRIINEVKGVNRVVYDISSKPPATIEWGITRCRIVSRAGEGGRPVSTARQARLHDLIRILEVRHGSTADELAEECAVTRRTIYRDLQAIEEAGYPLVKEPSGDGRMLYKFLTGFSKIPPITFSLSELMTLYLCRGQLGLLQGTPFLDDLDAVFARIRASLPPRSVAHLERLAQVITPRFQGRRDYGDKREILEALRRALLYQYRCTIRYAPARRPAADYLCDPYTLLFFKDALYVVGYVHNRRALRRFLVDRIESVQVEEERF